MEFHNVVFTTVKGLLSATSENSQIEKEMLSEFEGQGVTETQLRKSAIPVPFLLYHITINAEIYL